MDIINVKGTVSGDVLMISDGRMFVIENMVNPKSAANWLLLHGFTLIGKAVAGKVSYGLFTKPGRASVAVPGCRKG